MGLKTNGALCQKCPRQDNIGKNIGNIEKYLIGKKKVGKKISGQKIKVGKKISHLAKI